MAINANIWGTIDTTYECYYYNTYALTQYTQDNSWMTYRYKYRPTVYNPVITVTQGPSSAGYIYQANLGPGNFKMNLGFGIFRWKSNSQIGTVPKAGYSYASRKYSSYNGSLSSGVYSTWHPVTSFDPTGMKVLIYVTYVTVDDSAYNTFYLSGKPTVNYCTIEEYYASGGPAEDSSNYITGVWGVPYFKGSVYTTAINPGTKMYFVGHQMMNADGTNRSNIFAGFSGSTAFQGSSGVARLIFANGGLTGVVEWSDEANKPAVVVKYKANSLSSYNYWFGAKGDNDGCQSLFGYSQWGDPTIVYAGTNNSSNITSGTIYHCVIGWQPTYDEVKEVLAQYPFVYSTKKSDAGTSTPTGSDFFGEFDDDGFTGDISEGVEITDNDSYNTTDNSTRDPSIGVDENAGGYTDKVDLNTPAIAAVGAFNKTFALTGTELKQIYTEMWSTAVVVGMAAGLLGEIGASGSAWFSNLGMPNDCIIDLRMYPFDIINALQGGVSTSEPIPLYWYVDSGFKAPVLTETSGVIDLGSIYFSPAFGNFLDYEPYTTAGLYIPYIGEIKLPTSVFLGHNVDVKLIVDLITGAGTAVVYKDGIPYTYKNGQIGITLPIQGRDAANFASSITRSALGTIKTITSAGSPSDVAGGISKSIAQLNDTDYFTTPASGGGTSLYQPQSCLFIVDRPIVAAPSNYGHTIGYACSYTATLSTLNGFTCCEADLSSVVATEQEKDEIKTLLNNGVYL